MLLPYSFPANNILYKNGQAVKKCAVQKVKKDMKSAKIVMAGQWKIF